MRFPGIVLSFSLVAAAAAPAAEIRVVSLNASNVGVATSGPRPGMELILSAIGSAVSDDPLIPGDSGIVRPVDVLCLQEARSSATTAAAYAGLLNQIYATDRYAAGTLDGATTGGGTQVVVYNRATVTLLGAATVGTASLDAQPRQTLRYQFRPVGLVSPEADVFVYNAHFKAGSSAADRDRRLIEAEAIRLDADALGPGRNVVYLGDLNVPQSSETMYQRLQAPGPGRAVDPIAAPGVWSNNAAFAAIHTQSPWDPELGAVTGFAGSGGGVDDRYDQQLISAAMADGSAGLSYAPNSYYAFGNDGSHRIEQPINSGTGASPPVLAALAGIIDHLPIVADYRLRPRPGLAHPGDANLDVVTDLADFSVLAANFNRPGDWFAGDFDGDQFVGLADFAVLAGNFNTAATARAAAVPEPVGCLLLAASAALSRRRRAHLLVRAPPRPHCTGGASCPPSA